MTARGQSEDRWQQLAEVLMHHSTEVRTGDRVVVIMRETDTLPLVRCVYREAVKAGAYPQVLFSSSCLERDLMLHGSREQLDWVPEVWRQALEWADVCVDLRGATNPFEFEGVSSEVLSAHKKSDGIIAALRTRGTRWVLVRVPNESFAQQAQRSLETIMNMFFGAALLDWEEESRRYQRIQKALEGSASIRIEGQGTELHLDTRGRSFVVEDGHINIPGGEVYTAPVEDSTEGVISFEHPGVYAGILIPDIRLEFRKGEIVSATASRHQDLLQRLIAMDDGAKRVGELGFGTNPKLDAFCDDILYDEKIQGTVHIALGRSYAECGGLNDSALHWDIIKDLRLGGKVYADDRLVVEDGQFVI
ncbi:MAG: aminopeptidase [Spirochaetales bacterium]|nr:aminopeptidase [Spirochaetales bacterium]